MDTCPFISFIYLTRTCHDLKLTIFSVVGNTNLLEHGNTFQVAPGSAYRFPQESVGFWVPHWLEAPLFWAQQLSVCTGSSHNQGLTFAGESNLS